MSTPSEIAKEKFDYAVHLGNVLLKDDFAGAPLCVTGDESVVRGAIRTVIDLAITAARAADAKEIERLKAENAERQNTIDGLSDRLYGSRELWVDQCDKETLARAQVEADEWGVPVDVNVHGRRVTRLHPRELSELRARIEQLTTDITAKAASAAKEIHEYECASEYTSPREALDSIAAIITREFGGAKCP